MVKSDLDALNKLIHELEFEGTSGARAEVISPGSIPLKPDSDHRLAAAATAGGGIFLIGMIVIAVGRFIAKRRARAAAA